MKININEIAGTEADFAFITPVTEFAFSPDELILKDEVHVKAKIEKIAKEILLKGNIKTQLELECSRCLEHFFYPIDENFQVIFEPFSPNTTEEEVELKKDDLDIEIYKDDIIDLTEIVREQILLAIPMIPICSEECQGLCSQCGENLNYNKCSCVSKKIDPRWSKLKNLINKKTMPN